MGAQSAGSGPWLPKAGDVLHGHIEILRPIGAGGMGAVFEARNRRIGRHVAVKVLRPELSMNAAQCQRFLNEAMACGGIQHPNVVNVTDAGVHEGAPFIVMELLRGESMIERLKHVGRLSVQEAVSFVAQAASGVAAAHRAGVIHRDLKPDNLFISERPESPEPVIKVLDFGVSKLAEEGRTPLAVTTGTGVIVGTPIYMSPEQARGLKDIDHRADVYGLGAVLFHALTGRLPYVADNYNALIAAILTTDPPAPRDFVQDVPEAVNAVVVKAMNRDRDQRYATVDDFAAALREAGGLPALTSPRISSPPGEFAETMPAGAVAPVATSRQPSSAASPAAPVAGTLPPQPSGSRTGRRIGVTIGIAAVLLAGVLAAREYWSGKAAATGGNSSAGDEASGTGGATKLPAMPELARSRAKGRRVAIIPVRGAVAEVDPHLAWAISSRIIEEIDHYEELRPISSAGILVARRRVLPGPVQVPDQAEASDMARIVGADTVAAVSAARADGEDLTVAIEVFDVSDPGSGRSTPRERLARADLDADGPSRLANALAERLARHFNLPTLTDELAERGPSNIDFDAWNEYTQAQTFVSSGRYDLAEARSRLALQHSPEHPLFEAMLGCSLSYQGKNDEALAVVQGAFDNMERLHSRRDRLVVEQDRTWVQAEAAKDRGDLREKRRLAQRLADINTELIRDYEEPLGYLYLGATYGYFFEDVPRARAVYAEARRRMPDHYPAYYEEVALIQGDRRMRAEASRLIWTYITCFRDGEMATFALQDARRWGLSRPEGTLPCPER